MSPMSCPPLSTPAGTETENPKDTRDPLVHRQIQTVPTLCSQDWLALRTSHVGTNQFS